MTIERLARLGRLKNPTEKERTMYALKELLEGGQHG